MTRPRQAGFNPCLSRSRGGRLTCRPTGRSARHEQTTIFRLRTGHFGLRVDLKRTGIMDSALCDCKEAEQTVHHILQDCPIWRKQRHQFWPQDESATTKLWGTAEDLRAPPGNMWTEGQSTADRPQKKKKKITSFSVTRMTRPRKAGFNPCFSRSRGGRLTCRPAGRSTKWPYRLVTDSAVSTSRALATHQIMYRLYLYRTNLWCL